MEGMSVDEIRDALQETYNLNDAVVESIEFLYKTKVGNKDNEKSVSICKCGAKLDGVIREHDDPADPIRALTLTDLMIKVHYRRGDMIEMSVNCNIVYMLDAIDGVGESIQSAYHCVPATKPCYLIMDHASGHSTDDTIE